MQDDITCALVDDDKGSIDLIAASLSEAFKAKGYTCTIYKYFNGLTFLSDLPTKKIDVLFCDIEMPSINGIELCKKIPAKNRPTIIFLSNREDLVFDALKVRPFDFIRKKNFLTDVHNIIGSYLNSISQRSKRSIIVKSSNGNSLSIEIENIMYIDSDLKFQRLHFVDGAEEIQILMTMSKLEELLNDYGFIRCHKSYIVNYRYIYSILEDTILLKNGTQIYLSKRKGRQIKDKYLELIENDKNIISQ